MFFSADISPEDLFNMFFGGGFPSGDVNIRRNYSFHSADRHHARNGNDVSISGTWTHMQT